MLEAVRECLQDVFDVPGLMELMGDIEARRVRMVEVTVIKHAAFDSAVNITLGLPIIRTSVDHGTALDIAGTGKANPSSLSAAIELAIELRQSDARSPRAD